MAEGAIDTHLLGAVTIHAAAHRNIAFFRENFPFGHLTVAGLAGGARIEMGAVAEADVGGDLVNPGPFDLAIGLGEVSQFPDRFAICLDRGMTLHAFGCNGDGHHFTGIGVWMTGLALNFGNAGVGLVAEGNGLLRLRLEHQAEQFQYE